MENTGFIYLVFTRKYKRRDVGRYWFKKNLLPIIIQLIILLGMVENNKTITYIQILHNINCLF
jgi:hypothetical protein